MQKHIRSFLALVGWAMVLVPLVGSGAVVYETLTKTGETWGLKDETLTVNGLMQLDPAVNVAGRYGFTNVEFKTGVTDLGTALRVGTVGTGGAGNAFVAKDCSFAYGDALLTFGDDAVAGTKSTANLTDCGLTFGGFNVYRGMTVTFDGCGLKQTSDTQKCLLAGDGTHPANLLFRNSYVTNLTLATTTLYHPSKMSCTFDGGEYDLRKLDMWKDGINLDLTVTNGAKVVFRDGAALYSGFPYYSYAPKSTFTIDSGSIAIDGTTGSFTLGYNASSGTSPCSDLTIRENGSFKAPAVSQALYVGRLGQGHLFVDGGLCDVGILGIGTEAPGTATKTSGVYQVGGTVRTYANGYRRVTVGGNASHAAEYELSDNGVIESSGVYVGTLGTFRPNGGTVKANVVSAFSGGGLVYGPGTVEIGANGLVLDTNGMDVWLRHELGKISGVANRLVKTGAGTLKCALSFAVTETAVANGKFLVGDGETTDYMLGTSLVVTNGATFSTAGAAESVRLDALTIDGGTLELDGGDSLTVDGDVVLKNLTLAFSEAPALDDVKTLLVCHGTMSRASRRELAKAVDAATAAAGTFYRLAIETDATTGATTVTVSRTSATPLAGETAWKGTSGDLWNDAANGWTDGVPDASKMAVFGTASSVRAVTVPSGAVVGGVRFAADGYRLSGAALDFDASRDSARIEATAGSGEIAAPVKVGDVLLVSNETQTTVTLSGTVSGGGLAKAGGGRLVLSGDNDFLRPPELTGGFTEVASAGALGHQALADDVVRLGANTLTVNGAQEAETSLDVALVVNTTGEKQSALVQTKTDASVKSLTCTRGGIVKYGPARLVAEVAQDETLVANCVSPLDSTWHVYIDVSRDLFVPPADGSGPDSSGSTFTANGVTVAEGELALVATGAATRPIVTATADWTVVGRRSTNATAAASLMLDGILYEASGTSFYLNNHTIGNPWVDGKALTLSPICQKSELHLDDAELKVATFYSNYGGYLQECRPRLTLTNATLSASSAVWLAAAHVAKASQSQLAVATCRAKDSSVVAPKIGVSGGIDATFENCLVGTTNGAWATFSLDRCAFGTLAFSAGSVFGVGTFDFTTGLGEGAFDTKWPLTLAFDDAEWQFGADDWTLDPMSQMASGMSAYFKVETRGKGLKFAPAAGKTLTVRQPITGTGALQVTGPGTVSLAEGTALFSGDLVLADGTLDLSATGVALTDRTISAGGTLKGVSLTRPTIVLDVADDWTLAKVPTFADCAFEGRVRVNVGHTEAHPLPAKCSSLVIARFTGTAPDVSRWRLVGTGVPGVRGKFSVRGNEIVMDVDRFGCIMYLR